MWTGRDGLQVAVEQGDAGGTESRTHDGTTPSEEAKTRLLIESIINDIIVRCAHSDEVNIWLQCVAWLHGKGPELCKDVKMNLIAGTIEKRVVWVAELLEEKLEARLSPDRTTKLLEWAIECDEPYTPMWLFARGQISVSSPFSSRLKTITYTEDSPLESRLQDCCKLV